MTGNKEAQPVADAIQEGIAYIEMYGPVQLAERMKAALATPSAETAQPVATVRHPNFSAGDLKRLAELPPGTALYALSQPQGELREGIDALADHQNWELDWGARDHSDEETDYGWRVHKCTGGKNDREWTLIGFGETPREALVAALTGRTAK